ncbi:MAG: hypothetical protein ACLTSL_10905 [Odoribacter splanchnicus]
MFSKLFLYIVSFIPKYRDFIIYEISSCRKIKAEIPLEFQKVTIGNVEDVLSFRTTHISHIFKSFLSNDGLGVYGYYKGKVIVHGWAVMNKTSAHKIVNGYFDLSPGAVLIHFCSVDVKYRGNKVYQELLSVLCGQLSDYDIYIDTDGNNYSAQKAIQRVGGIYKNKLSMLQCRSKFLLIKKS